MLWELFITTTLWLMTPCPNLSPLSFSTTAYNFSPLKCFRLCSIDHEVGCLYFKRKPLLDLKQGLVDPSDWVSSLAEED